MQFSVCGSFKKLVAGEFAAVVIFSSYFLLQIKIFVLLGSI